MASLKQDVALAVNLLGRDPKIGELMNLVSQADRKLRLIPMRQQPGTAGSQPIVSVYIKPGRNLGGPVIEHQLIADVYVPLEAQRNSGISFDITRRIKEVLQNQSIGRGLQYRITETDKRSTTGWHKSSVVFDFRSTQY